MRKRTIFTTELAEQANSYLSVYSVNSVVKTHRLPNCTSADSFPNSTVRVFDRNVQCLDLDWLIRVKRAAGRPRDLEAVAELEALREERDRH
jgi:hypothetical protein